MIRWIIGLVAPNLLRVALGGVLFGGSVSSWLLGWTDWKTAGLFLVCCVLIGLLTTTPSKTTRLMIAVVLGAALYIKGRIDEGLPHDKEIAELEESHNKAIASLHEQYKTSSEYEEARQARVHQEALQRADNIKAEFDSVKQRLRAELDKLKSEAANATDTAPVLDATDIAALNRLRYDPRTRARTRPVRGVKTKAWRSAGLDAKALPKASGVPKGRNVKVRTKGRVGPGRKAVRAVPAAPWFLGKTCEGSRCRIKWQWF